MRERVQLHEAISRVVDPMDTMQRVANEAMSAIEAAQGVVVGLAVGDTNVHFVCGAGYLEGQAGSVIAREGSLSGLAMSEGVTLRCDDATGDPRVNKVLSDAYGIMSSVAVPLRRGGQAVGVLNVNSKRRCAFDDEDVRVLTRLAGFVTVLISAAIDLTEVTDQLLSPDYVGQSDSSSYALAVEERFVANVLNPDILGSLNSRSRIEAIIRAPRLGHHFQPIFDLSNGEMFALEALARFPTRPPRPPDEWFAEARGVGLGTELEIVSLHLALEALVSLPSSIALCVNAGPGTLAATSLAEMLGALSTVDASRVVIELTEQIAVADYPRLAGSIESLREMGVRLAIDDTGAGFASLAHILKLDPDLIKLDRALTTGIDRDPVRQALASALVSFAQHTQAEIVAEGIESAAEMAILQGLGIRYGQGYFLGHPRPLDSISWQSAHPISVGLPRL